VRLPSVETALRVTLSAVAAFAPRRARPRILSLVPGFRVHPTSSIGCSFLCPSRSLDIGPHTRVGNLTLVRRLDRLEMRAYSGIGNLNTITGWPQGSREPYHATSPDRVPELVLGERAVITNRHYFDCADSVRLDDGSAVTGLRTVVLTHGLSIASGAQGCRPVRVGRCSLVTTTCVILGGSVLPDFCVLTPLSLLREAHTEKYQMYAGNPATAVRQLDPDAGFFRNAMGTP